MAYNLFKSGKYAEAATALNNYLGFEPSKREYTYEAQLRLADCHFMLRDYKQAAELYEKLLDDLKNENKSSPIFTHHIDYVNEAHYKREMPYEETEPNQIVVDYIASMTDDYFVDIYNYLFPNSTKKIDYKGYFE